MSVDDLEKCVWQVFTSNDVEMFVLFEQNVLHETKFNDHVHSDVTCTHVKTKYQHTEHDEIEIAAFYEQNFALLL